MGPRSGVGEDATQVAVALGDVEAVTDDEGWWNGEADVAEVEGHALLALFEQEGADFNALWFAGF